MKEHKNFIKKYPWRFYMIMAAVAAAIALLTFVTARYKTFFGTGEGQMTSEEFYFTTDLLGDGTMVSSQGENHPEGYRYEDVQEGSWHLYGGEQHEISIELRNYYDDLRVTKETIQYEIEAKATDKSGREISDLAQLQIGDKTATSHKGSLIPGTEGNQKAMEETTLIIKANKEVPYEEGAKVEVSVKSTDPYQKEMKLTFFLYRIDTFLSWEIRDKENSPYAELIIMTSGVESGSAGGAGGSVQPYLKWPEELFIDNTHHLTFTYDGTDNFTTMDGMENREMQISRTLEPGESEMLYFFKEDTDKNYSRSRTIVNPDSDNKYVIDLTQGTN